MKNLIKILVALPLIGIAITSCQPDKYKTIDPPTNNVATLAGTWKLTRVVQTDEDAKRKGFPYQQMDLTSLFPYTDFKITFNVNGATPTTFTTTPGNSPKIIRLTSGNWFTDDPAYPKMLTLANPTDTARITLGSYLTGINPSLKISLNKSDAATNKLVLSYSYEFTKQ